MKNEKFSFVKRLKSVTFAFNGLKILIREEHNARIHLAGALVTILMGLVLDISWSEWIALCFAIGFVFAMEAINSALENLADFITTEKHESIKKAKDLAASAVLISAISAFMVGVIIFVPKIIQLCSKT